VIENNAGFLTGWSERTAYLEEGINTLLNRTQNEHFNEMDRDNFYHLLSAYRGVSAALLEYSGNAKLIDWAEWREARF